jgi:hypothetical protein
MDDEKKVLESMPGPYDYERIGHPIGGLTFRIYDAHNDRIATAYDEAHAKLIVTLLNRALSITS